MSLFIPGTSVRSYDEIQDLDPWAVEQYLDLSGWHRIERIPNTYAVWVRDDDAASLLLPYDDELRDFRRRYREALDTLSQVTGLEGEALALEVVSARKDVFLLRADQITFDGSIPFLEAQRLIDGVQTLLTTAAATTIRPRASTAGRKPALVSDFMRDDVRMGHTLHGSFVITVLAADAAEEARRRRQWIQEQDDKDSGSESPDSQEVADRDMMSFPRQVMATLATGLEATRQLSGSSDSATIEEAVASGVTVQLLKSVQAMGQAEGLRALDMAFKWSRTEPVVDDDVPSRIELTRQDSAEVDNYINSFSKQPEVVEDHILGQVVRLDRAEGSEDGQVVVEGMVGKQRRRVKVPLSGDAYRAAIAAHDASRPVSVTGTFTRRNRGWRMEPGAVIGELSLPQ